VLAAVILENFMEVALGDSKTIDQEKLNEFVEVWTELDPDAGNQFCQTYISCYSLHTCIYIPYMYIHTHIYTYIRYIHTHIYTYTRTHTHTQVCIEYVNL